MEARDDPANHAHRFALERRGRAIRLPIRIAENSREPIYHQIERQIIALIVGGQLSAGTPLPSIRALAKELSCSVITTRRAYQNLEQQGYIRTIQGKGTFVAEVKAEKKEQVAHETLYEAFRRAIGMSLDLKRTPQETREIFERVLKELTEKRGIRDE
ncbi:transcriptional regulator, GntR family [Planifilum fulgidum]|uniref:Transcriptional regulator, GntR family n=1 Tax=Planifilum fulgidum TaxID=201973 RepID=A0A1I2RG46_9BACL|nr:transcriptional regulator, GntR family [Planifilum fulgidum]